MFGGQTECGYTVRHSSCADFMPYEKERMPGRRELNGPFCPPVCVRAPFCYCSFISPGATRFTSPLHSPRPCQCHNFVQSENIVGQKMVVLSVKDMTLIKKIWAQCKEHSSTRLRQLVLSWAELENVCPSGLALSCS